MNTSIFYEIEYTYYQYNSGAADNGRYTKRIRTATPEEAAETARKINLSAAGQLSDEADHELRSRLIPWDGYFINAVACEVLEKREQLSL